LSSCSNKLEVVPSNIPKSSERHNLEQRLIESGKPRLVPIYHNKGLEVEWAYAVPEPKDIDFIPSGIQRINHEDKDYIRISTPVDLLEKQRACMNGENGSLGYVINPRAEKIEDMVRSIDKIKFDEVTYPSAGNYNSDVVGKWPTGWKAIMISVEGKDYDLHRELLADPETKKYPWYKKTKKGVQVDYFRKKQKVPREYEEGLTFLIGKPKSERSVRTTKREIRVEFGTAKLSDPLAFTQLWNYCFYKCREEQSGLIEIINPVLNEKAKNILNIMNGDYFHIDGSIPEAIKKHDPFCLNLHGIILKNKKDIKKEHFFRSYIQNYGLGHHAEIVDMIETEEGYLKIKGDIEPISNPILFSDDAFVKPVLHYHTKEIRNYLYKPPFIFPVVEQTWNCRKEFLKPFEFSVGSWL